VLVSVFEFETLPKNYWGLLLIKGRDREYGVIDFTSSLKNKPQKIENKYLLNWYFC